MNAKNIEDLPEFLKLAWKLRVQEIRCFYMTLFVPDHIELSCFFDQEKANASIRKAQEMSRVLAAGAGNLPQPKAFQVNLPPLFDRTQKPSNGSHEICYDPWQHIYVELQGSVIPCCFWGEHIGNLTQGDELDAIWNNEFYQNLRRGMASGDPHPWCKSCIRYSGYNVDNIYCHLTNRPRQQAVILREVLRRGLDAGPYFKAEDLGRLEASRI